MLARVRHDKEEESEHPPQPATAEMSTPLTALRVQNLQRTFGNQATARMIQRMSVVEAVTAATEGGATGEQEEITRLATEGKRFDPIGKEWVMPAREKLWDDFYALHKRSAKFQLSYKAWEEKQLAKGDTSEDDKKVLDVNDHAQLKALWGPSPVFDKWERATAIAKMFTDGGVTVEAPEESKPGKTSSKTPPVLFKITDHKMITMFEIHPGGGIHKAPYIRISTQKGMIKVINSSVEPKYDQLQEKAVIYIDVA